MGTFRGAMKEDHRDGIVFERRFAHVVLGNVTTSLTGFRVEFAQSSMHSHDDD
jgi:hypothetical protein